MKNRTTPSKTRRVKAWAVLYRKDYLRSVRPSRLRFADCAGAISVFGTKKDAEYFVWHPTQEIIPCTIILPTITRKKKRI